MTTPHESDDILPVRRVNCDVSRVNGVLFVRTTECTDVVRYVRIRPRSVVLEEN